MKKAMWWNLGAVVSLGVVGYVGYHIWLNTPPFEKGVHISESHTSPEGGPMLGQCPIFPADNIWNVPIDKVPKLRETDTYIDSIGPLRKVHADFGSNLKYGIPYTEPTAETRPVPVQFGYANESDPGNYLIPPDTPIEGGGILRGDAHAIVVDTRKCVLYELYHADPQNDGSWNADSGIKMDLRSNELRPAGWTSGDAAGLPIFPGLVRYDEVEAGAINHALRFTVQHTQAAYVWPARHKASPSRSLDLPPMGVRFRLRADFDISKYTKADQVIMIALKKYGMFLADNGGSMYLSGVGDKRWTREDLRGLTAMAAEDFEAVDDTLLQMKPDSGQARTAGLR